jgi:hypothetical protein
MLSARMALARSRRLGIAVLLTEWLLKHDGSSKLKVEKGAIFAQQAQRGNHRWSLRLLLSQQRPFC